jgi:DNA (cytosine-5)-methyltransferase 1
VRYLDVCAGISASTVAWKPLGWEAAAYSEIEPAPRAILAHHYPDTPLHGDFTTIQGDEYGTIDLLVGGTPCQDFSVAGLRAGLDGDRGKLSLEFLRLADRTRARWLVWENVPGVLSQDGGRAFGAILGGMGELGYGVAYRVLDARYFESAGQRARVFVVACLGNWRAPAAALLERSSLGAVEAPRLSRSDIHGCLSRGVGSRLNLDGSLTLIPTEQGYRFVSPVEGERIMGFPDNYTLVPFRGRMMSDRARYEALGNSMHTGVMRWIGKRIAAVDALGVNKRIAA